MLITKQGGRVGRTEVWARGDIGTVPENLDYSSVGGLEGFFVNQYYKL